MSDDVYSDALCEIMAVPREMHDKALAIAPELRAQVEAGEIDFEEAFRRSRQ